MTFDLSKKVNLIFCRSTGRVAFDAMGDRLFAEYKIINIQREGGGQAEGEVEHVIVGNYSYTNVGTIIFVISSKWG